MKLQLSLPTPSKIFTSFPETSNVNVLKNAIAQCRMQIEKCKMSRWGLSPTFADFGPVMPSNDNRKKRVSKLLLD
jgi:hypothetical protein